MGPAGDMLFAGAGGSPQKDQGLGWGSPLILEPQPGGRMGLEEDWGSTPGVRWGLWHP